MSSLLLASAILLILSVSPVFAEEQEKSWIDTVRDALNMANTERMDKQIDVSDPPQSVHASDASVSEAVSAYNKENPVTSQVRDSTAPTLFDMAIALDRASEYVSNFVDSIPSPSEIMTSIKGGILVAHEKAITYTTDAIESAYIFGNKAESFVKNVMYFTPRVISNQQDSASAPHSILDTGMYDADSIVSMAFSSDYFVPTTSDQGVYSFSMTDTVSSGSFEAGGGISGGQTPEFAEIATLVMAVSTIMAVTTMRFLL